MMKSLKDLSAFLLYCLPAIFAAGILINGLHNRTSEVAVEITAQARAVLSGDPTIQRGLAEDYYKDNDVYQRLVRKLERDKATGNLEDEIKSGMIQTRLMDAWVFTSTLIAGLTLLPFILMGSRVAFGRLLSERRTNIRIARTDMILKFLVAFVTAYGWIYVLHPIGRGASMAHGYIVSSDILSANTLPIYIDSNNLLSPTICGFLGWYLHLLGYFFQKFLLGDVSSTRVYGLLFKKMLFVWGIALVVSSLVASEEGKLVMFLIGFFPLSARSMIRDYGMKMVQGSAKQEDSLTQIPALSRWQIIRLEEEAIDTVPALAAANPAALKAATPLRPEMIDFWIDCARLLSLLGAEKYELIKGTCITATEFILRTDDPDFVQNSKVNHDINNPKEITRVLQETFGAQAAHATRK
jgi:hypothetical protein